MSLPTPVTVLLVDVPGDLIDKVSLEELGWRVYPEGEDSGNHD